MKLLYTLFMGLGLIGSLNAMESIKEKIRNLKVKFHDVFIDEGMGKTEELEAKWAALNKAKQEYASFPSEVLPEDALRSAEMAMEDETINDENKVRMMVALMRKLDKAEWPITIDVLTQNMKIPAHKLNRTIYIASSGYLDFFAKRLQDCSAHLKQEYEEEFMQVFFDLHHKLGEADHATVKNFHTRASRLVAKYSPILSKTFHDKWTQYSKEQIEMSYTDKLSTNNFSFSEHSGISPLFSRKIQDKH